MAMLATLDQLLRSTDHVGIHDKQLDSGPTQQRIAVEAASATSSRRPGSS
jgi:hypothetical protein